MKNIKFLFLILISSMLLTGVVFAQEDASQIIKNQEIKLEDLGVSSAGILPSNPFYFLKEWTRGIKKSFAFSAIKKAELQLEIVNERAAELKKLKEILSLDSKVLTSSLTLYKDSLDFLKEKIKNLNIEDSVVDSRNDSFLNRLSENTIKHIKLFSELKEDGDDENNKLLSELQEKTVEIIAEVPERLETSSEFKNRLEEIIKNQKNDTLKEVTIIEVLNQFGEKMSKETRLELFKIKEDLLIKFQSRLQSEDFNQVISEILTQLPGDPIRRVMMLDEIREGAINSEAKNEINLIRQELLTKAEDDGKIGKIQTENIIQEAEELLKDFQENINLKSTPKSVIINEFFTKAEFNLEQARKTHSLGNYGQAFGQASVSVSSSYMGLNYISKFNLDTNSFVEDDIEELKEHHDELINKTKEMSLDKDDLFDIDSLLEESEKNVVKISDLDKKKTKTDTLISLLKNSKLLLFQIDNTLSEMSEPHQE